MHVRKTGSLDSASKLPSVGAFSRWASSNLTHKLDVCPTFAGQESILRFDSWDQDFAQDISGATINMTNMTREMSIIRIVKSCGGFVK